MSNARVLPCVRPHGRTALALRGEHYHDEDGAISGTPQTLKELTATLEHKRAAHVTLKLEGRYDRSSADVFAGDDSGNEASGRRNNQFLVILGAVASF